MSTVGESREASSPTPSASLRAQTPAGHGILQPPGWPAPKGYSNGIVAEGRIIVTGGVIGWDEFGVFPPTFVGQARQTFRNIAAILAAAEASPDHLIRLTWYVTDMDEYLAEPKALGSAYREVFGRSFPAMAAVQVVRLVERSAKIEIEATAVLPFRDASIATSMRRKVARDTSG